LESVCEQVVEELRETGPADREPDRLGRSVEVDRGSADARPGDRLFGLGRGVDGTFYAWDALLGAEQVRHEAFELRELPLHRLKVSGHEGRVAVHRGERVLELVHRRRERVLFRPERAAQTLDVAPQLLGGPL